ncbi:TPA: TIGR03761 family integrating conjugative element protein [Klebsiella pneumoniae]|nr:TIGR03761 family integrating conjugative element protein [Klebsiella pneumoniae]
MSENSKPQHPTPGALRSELRIELHTRYAISLWQGRRSSEGKSAIMGMPRFFQLAGRINQDSLTDNPWADATMLHLEKLIGASHQQMQTLLDEVDALFADMPGSVKLTDCIAETALNVAVHSHTPIGYRCVYLLVGFDQLALRVFQAHFFGLISTQTKQQYLSSAGYAIRRIYGAAQRYRSVAVTRADVLANNDTAQQAIAALGEVSASVVSGQARSGFSPALNSPALTVAIGGKKGKRHG